MRAKVVVVFSQLAELGVFFRRRRRLDACLTALR